MTRRIKLWSPGRDGVARCYTEAHRRPEHAESLARELEALGVDCVADREPGCDACLSGSIWLSDQAQEALDAGLPLVSYCWDLYPWQLDGSHAECWKPHLWQDHLGHLKASRDVWVPSRSAADRVVEFTGRDAHVVLTAVHPWEHPVSDQGHVVEVMRPYPDRMAGAVKRACDELGVPCVERAVCLPWDEFKAAVAGASLLVSAYDEASTGGLTLLEGHWLGKPVLVSNSPRQGARDYFDTQARYFRYDSEGSLRSQIADSLRHDRGPWSPKRLAAARAWVEGEHSDAAMARRMADRLREVL